MAETIARPLATTAEWLCTKCGVTNRKYVPAGTTVSQDSCVACHTKHTIWASDRPVRWNSERV
jgi:hypothetical protein